MAFPTTSHTLLARLKGGEDEESESVAWQVSWRRFLELYHGPLAAVARGCYRHHTGGAEPTPEFIEDVVADVISAFFSRSRHTYREEKGRLRGYLRVITNARVVDALRRERPLDHRPLPESPEAAQGPAESPQEIQLFYQSLLATLIEDLRHQIPLRQFEVFERVKLKHQTPVYVAESLGLSRAMVDRYVHKAMSKLREIATKPEYQQEYLP